MMKIYDLNEVPEEEIFARQEEAVDVSAPVADILRAVKERGDAALLEYEKQFDRVELSALEVTPQELEEGAAQYAAPDGLADTFFRTAGDIIRLKRIPCYRTAQCFDETPHGAVYFDDEYICFDRPAFERVCQEAKCSSAAVKRELSEKEYLLGQTVTKQSYETRISLRVNGKGRYTARVYKFERARFEVFGEPALFEGGNGQ